MLQDKHDNVTGLYTLALKDLSAIICAAQKLAVG
jgi:hypothetical protein